MEKEREHRAFGFIIVCETVSRGTELYSDLGS